MQSATGQPPTVKATEQKHADTSLTLRSVATPELVHVSAPAAGAGDTSHMPKSMSSSGAGTLQKKRLPVFHDIFDACHTQHHPKAAPALRFVVQLSSPSPSGNGPTPYGAAAARKRSRKQAIQNCQKY